jgi:hypothetical protein
MRHLSTLCAEFSLLHRADVLSAIPSLKCLDGREVSDPERLHAKRGRIPLFDQIHTAATTATVSDCATGYTARILDLETELESLTNASREKESDWKRTLLELEAHVETMQNDHASNINKLETELKSCRSNREIQLRLVAQLESEVTALPTPLIP